VVLLQPETSERSIQLGIPLKTEENPGGLVTEKELFNIYTTIVRLSLISCQDMLNIHLVRVCTMVINAYPSGSNDLCTSATPWNSTSQKISRLGKLVPQQALSNLLALSLEHL
jgi:hypothetical protein